MYIAAGFLKRKRLVYDDSLRPTKQRVKEAMFDIVQSHIADAVVLDACCGTGALALEAYSRGAKHVVAVDSQIRLVQQNAKALAASIDIIKNDIVAYIQKDPPAFDVVFLDPPWDAEGIYVAVLDYFLNLEQPPVLLCEYRKGMPLGHEATKVYRYGKTEVALFRPGD